MNPLSILPRSKSELRLYYLGPFSLIYLFSLTERGFYLELSAIALVGAVAQQTWGEALFGPSAEEQGEIDYERQVKRIGTILFRDKKPFGYSGSSISEVVAEGEASSYRRMGMNILLFLTIFSMYIVSLFAIVELWRLRYRLDFIGVGLLAALVAMPLYVLLRIYWPDAHSMDEEIPEFDQDFQDRIINFTYMLNAEDIRSRDIKYFPEIGGELNMACSSDAESERELVKDIYTVAIGFSGLVEKSAYPISKGVFTILCDEREIEFVVQSRWAEEYNQGEMDRERYSRLVMNTASGEKIPSRISFGDLESHSNSPNAEA